jgi:hypothetical protein
VSTAPAAQNAKEAVVLFNAQREKSMAFAAMISELYDAFRRKVGTDEAPAEPAAETAVLEGARFHSILEKVEALSRGSDQRFESLSQGLNVLNRRFDEINQPLDRLVSLMDKRFDALTHAADQRAHLMSRAMEERLGAFGHSLGQRVDALNRTVDERFAMQDERCTAMDQRFGGIDVQLARLETNVAQLLERPPTFAEAARELRYLRWGVGILMLLVLGLMARMIFDWLML